MFCDGKNEFLPKSSITNVFNRAFEKSGLGVSRTHVCRRTFVTLGTNATCIEAVQRAVGHSNRVTTEGYLDLRPEEQVNFSEGIEGLDVGDSRRAHLPVRPPAMTSNEMGSWRYLCTDFAK